MNFPANALTYTTIVSGTQNIVITNSTSTVYGVHMTQENVASLTNLLCGTNVIARNYAKDYTLDMIQYECNNTLSISKTGNDEAMITVTYATGTQKVSKELTYGDAIISLLLTIAIIFNMSWLVYQYARGVRLRQ